MFLSGGNMNKQAFNSIVVITAISSLMLTAPAQARMKCWKNNEGITECGDKVPPEFAQKGHKEIGESGIVREEVERAKTLEELAEEERLAKLEEERLQEEEQKRLKDRLLLDTFSSVEEINKQRDDNILAVEAQIKAMELRRENIEADLNKRTKDAADIERSGKEPNKALKKDIESIERQLTDIDEWVSTKRQEQDQIRASYAKDIDRYKELKGMQE